MFWSPINQLTPEQEAQINQLQTRWRAIAFMPHLDQPVALDDSIANCYQAIDQTPPKILTYASPYMALSTILTDLIQQLDNALMQQLEHYIQRQQTTTLDSEIARYLLGQTLKPIQQMCNSVRAALYKHRSKRHFMQSSKRLPSRS